MKRQRAGRIGLVVMLTGMLAAGSGCVAFNVGRPETFSFEVPAGEETRTTGREVLFGQVVAETRGGGGDGGTVGVEISLHGMVDRTEQKGRKVNMVEVTQQKRLSFGFFPGLAETVPRRNDWAICLDSDPAAQARAEAEPPVPWYMPGMLCVPVIVPAYLAAMGVVASPMVPYFAFGEPVMGSWICRGDVWMENGVFWELQGNDGVSFRKLGASDLYRKDGLQAFVHLVPFGFFRHSFLKFSEEREGEWTPTGPARHVRETVAAKGPYRVEMRIPALRYEDSRVAWRGAEKVRFDVPRGNVPGEVVALVKCRSEGTVLDESRRALLEDASKWTQVVPLWLPGPEGAEVRVVVEAARTRGAPLRYAKERDMGNGGARWVVEIMDESLEALDVAAFARPLILDELRAEWLERHPEEDAGSVGAWADWRSGENDRTLVFSGAAFSVRPVADGWRYDAATRRGEVRWMVPEDADAEAVRRWARENVESIARDRAAVLKAGEAVPEGGRYRSLSERLANGVLTLEFEVVQ